MVKDLNRLGIHDKIEGTVVADLHERKIKKVIHKARNPCK